MVQLLLITLMIVVGGLFLFSIKLFFLLKEILFYMEELEGEIVKIKKQLADLEVKSEDLEKHLKFLLFQLQKNGKEKEQ